MLATKQVTYKPKNKEIRLLSANVRGFHTNVGELTHRFVNKNKADIVFLEETFLDDRVPPNYARIPGYTTWIRKDRNSQGGGIAMCYKEDLHIQVIDFPVPDALELLIFKLIDANGQGILCCGCYRPPSQGTLLFDFLIEKLDNLLLENNCQHILMFGDLNQHGVQLSFDHFLAAYDLHNHVEFPTHRSGSSLDPVITDISDNMIKCSPVGYVGTSDHQAVLTKLEFMAPKEEIHQRKIWQWEKADWKGLRHTLSNTDWDSIVKGSVNNQAKAFTNHLIKLQHCFVPHKYFSSKPSDQPWFGPQCKAASDEKYKLWLRLKHRPTSHNKRLHRQAAAKMERVEKWAINKWENNIKNKLRGGQVGSKMWWNIIKEKQGLVREDKISPLSAADGTVALSTAEKVNVLAQHFANKMTVPDIKQQPPQLPSITQEKMDNFRTNQSEVHGLLHELDEKKAVGPDGISPRLLRRCAKQLAQPLARIYNNCLGSRTWPNSWKISNVVPIHKKGSKTEVSNYRPVSLLSTLSKILERIIATRITKHLQKHHILSTRQFGFRKGHSAADLHLLMTSSWTAALDKGLRTCILALDIEGAFDRVWHKGLLTKLKAVGLEGGAYILLQNYLSDRKLRVVLEGQESFLYNINAGVPQGSVLGPLLWNIFINDLLHLIPEARAFADDGTLSVTYEPAQENAAVMLLNTRLRSISEWGKRWQVKFASHKTQFMVSTRANIQLQVNFDGDLLSSQDEINILGVIFDRKLTFKTHIENIARNASRKLAALRRISWILDREGREVLYKAQIRSSMEYSSLTWGGAAKKHLCLLDKIQNRAKRIIEDNQPPSQRRMDSLQHRRDVAGMSTLFKIQEENSPHLHIMRLAQRQPLRTTRRVEQAPNALEEPRCHTSHYQRQFSSKYSKLWNEFLSFGFEPQHCTLQVFKCAVNIWLNNLNNNQLL